MSEESINWKVIIIKALITGGISLLVGCLLILAQTPPESRLEYYSDSIIYDGHNFQNEKVGIFEIIIQNNGHTFIEDIDGVVDFRNAVINDANIWGFPEIRYGQEESYTNSFEFNIDNLNPKENVTVSFLVTSNESEIIKPSIYLRGKGVIGTEIMNMPSTSSTFAKAMTTYVIIMTAIFGIISVFVSILYKDKIER